MRRGLVVCTAVFILLGSGVVAQTPPASAQKSDQQDSDVLKVAPPPRRVEPPSPTATADELERKADELRAQKMFLDAIDYYHAALAKGATAAVYNKLGIAELQLSRLPDARKDFQRALKKDKKFAEAHNNLGAVYYAEKKYKKAVKQYRKAIAVRDDMASFHSNLGTAYFGLKDYENATAEYNRALQLDPDVFERHSTAGIAAQMTSTEDRARYSYVLAKMYAKLGQPERSLQYLKKAMEEGYTEIDKVYKEDEFAELRKDPRFAQLMAQKPAAIPQ